MQQSHEVRLTSRSSPQGRHATCRPGQTVFSAGSGEESAPATGEPLPRISSSSVSLEGRMDVTGAGKLDGICCLQQWSRPPGHLGTFRIMLLTPDQNVGTLSFNYYFLKNVFGAGMMVNGVTLHCTTGVPYVCRF